MPIEIQLRQPSAIPIEVDGVVEAALAATSLGDLERFAVQHGNRQEPLAELFSLSGVAGDAQVIFAGELASVHRIGEAMTAGAVTIDGDAGRHVGARMRGGTIDVRGSASDWLGAEMRGGTIRVRGNAGDFAGAAYVGSPVGMRGGEIHIEGSAGDRVAHSMRRGMIAVRGAVGMLAGLDMIAGSVLAFGGCGPRPGAGMRRGTIAIGGDIPDLLPTFRPAGACRPTILRVVLLHLRRQGFAIDEAWLDAEYQLFSGDHLNGGRGEVLVHI